MFCGYLTVESSNGEVFRLRMQRRDLVKGRTQLFAVFTPRSIEHDGKVSIPIFNI